VVVPAHNAADTITAAITSALGQQPPPLEVVVVDDGSTDATAAVVDQLAADRPTAGIRLLSQACAGPSAARNRGIEACRGDWVGFLDADDVWHPDKWTLQTEALDRHPEAVAAAADWVATAGPGRAPARPPGTAPLSIVTEADLLLLNRFQTSTVVARTATLRRLGGFDSRLDGVEDWDLWRRLAGLGPIVKVDLPLVTYTDRPEGYSKDLARVYATAQRMLADALAPLPRRDRRRIAAWHHLRFAVGFALAGDRRAAATCLGNLWRAGLVSAAPSACRRHLLPFLAGRLRRRRQLAAGQAGG
jgi:glycosyltransferase involved in cell wall biosynthesis